MLVLTRDADDGTNKVIISVPEGPARQIVVTVSWISNRRVGLGFDAERAVIINRSEVQGTYKRRERE